MNSPKSELIIKGELKKKIRADMLALRNALIPEKKNEYDAWICSRIWALVISNQVKELHTYLPMGSEINIFPLIRKALSHRLTVFVPKALPNGQLTHLELRSLNQLQDGLFGTQHPFPEIEYKGSFDLIIVPGLACNKDKYRLGYGGGYYDRFLAAHPDAKSIGVFYPFQEVDELPVEEHDVPLQDVIIEK